MNIVNPDTPDDLSSGLCKMSDMSLYPILLMLRPPRTDLYARIIQASPENHLRLTYSFAIDYLKNGANTIFLRQGIMMRIQGGEENFIIFNPIPAYVDLSIVYSLIPVPYTKNYVEAFCAANRAFTNNLTTARVSYVKPGYVVLVPA